MMTIVGRKSGTHDTVDTPDLQLGDEHELIRRCRNGERAAQEALYKRHRRQVAANLYRVLNDRTDLDDLVQEVFVIAFRGLARFRGEARLSTWLYRICVNVGLGRIRARSRRPPAVPLPQPLVEHAGNSPDSPARLLERQQDRELVQRVLAELPPKKRIVLTLHEIEGRDIREIAYIVDAPQVTVRTRLFYARKEFYRRIAEGGD